MFKTINILLAFCCCRSICQDDIHFKAVGSAGIVKADPMVQRVTPSSYNWPTALFYDQDTEYLYWVDQKGNSTVYCWYFRTGVILPHYFPELKGEPLAFALPIKDEPMGYLVGSAMNIRKVTMKADHSYDLSEPLVSLKEPDCKIVAARADCNGKLFIVTKSWKLDLNGGKLYKIEQNKATLVAKFNEFANSFAWNNDCSKLYVLTAKELYEYSYDTDAGTVDNRQLIFSVKNLRYSSKDFNKKFIGINVDTDNGLWFSIEPTSVIVNLKYPDWSLQLTIKQTGLPTTSSCFGGYKNKNLFTATHKMTGEPNNPYAAYGSIFGTSGLNVTGCYNYKPNDL